MLKVDDQCWGIQCGNAVVRGIRKDKIIVMNLVTRTFYEYTLDGRYQNQDYARSLFESKPDCVLSMLKVDICETPKPQGTPIIGQEAICPDGLGRVTSITATYIGIETYVNNRSWNWDPRNIELIDPRR